MASNDGLEAGDRDFEGSKLGTKEYWDEAYERENEAFEDIGDVGEIWFGEDTVEKILDWIDDCEHINVDDSIIDLGCGNGMMFGEDTMEKILDWIDYCEEVNVDDSIIDLGCGNGMMCIELRKRDYKHLTGVDYSDLAVMLAQSVAKSEGFEDIEFMSGDLISEERPNPCTCLTRQYKLVLDKGTYDAISLMPEDAATAQRKYKDTVKSIMKPDSLFSLTSCNWSKDQLLNFFKEDFHLVAEIPFKTFQFGGQTGSTVTSLVFKLKT